MKKYIALAALAVVLSIPVGSKAFAAVDTLYCDCATGNGTETTSKACGKKSDSYAANAAACVTCCGAKPAPSSGLNRATPGVPTISTAPGAANATAGSALVNVAAGKTAPPTQSKVGPLPADVQKQIEDIAARVFPGTGVTPSVEANRKKTCEEAGGNWVSAQWIFGGENPNGSFNFLTIIPAHCIPGAATGATQ